MNDKELLAADRKTLTPAEKAKQTRLKAKLGISPSINKETPAEEAITDSPNIVETPECAEEPETIEISEEETGVAVIEVLTPEQIKILPKKVKEDIVFLTETVGASELQILNPLAKVSLISELKLSC